MPKELIRPVSDYHVHLGGALPPSTLWEMAFRHGLSGWKTPELQRFYDFVRFMTLHDSGDLAESPREAYEAFFKQSRHAVAEAIQRGPLAVQEASFHAVSKAYRRNHGALAHLDLRFDPYRRVAPEDQRWTSLLRIIIAARDGIEEASELYGLSTRLILCADRNELTEARAAQLVELALAARVHGLDVCGLEATDAPERDPAWLVRTLRPFEKAWQQGLFITYHVGENPAVGSAPVLNVLRTMDVTRIGHGITLLHALPDLDSSARDSLHGTVFELCPTSNLVTGVADRAYLERCLTNALNFGVAITINTDNPALLGVTATGEHALARRLLRPEDHDRFDEHLAQSRLLMH